MKITDIAQQIKPESKRQVENNRESKKSSQGLTEHTAAVDTVELSSASREAVKIRAIIEQTPAVRVELVQGLKGKVESGEYQVDSRKVAEKMILNFLSEDLSST
jgi:negative regulator of flagellin synthesis FlgM